MTTAKEMANSALVYLDFDNIYSGGASANERQFGLDFGTACVEQISNKIDTVKNVSVDFLNSEFKKLLTVTQSLNDSDFSFAMNTFRDCLLKKVDMHVAIVEFLNEKNINSVTNEFYNSNMADQKYRDQIAKHVSAEIQQNKNTVEQLPLNIVLEYMGAYKKEDENKWKVPETGHNIAILNQSWHDFNTNKSGAGSISLLAYHNSLVNNISPKTKEEEIKLWLDARNELLAEFGLDLHLNKEQDKVAQVQVDKEESSNPRFKM